MAKSPVISEIPLTWLICQLSLRITFALGETNKKIQDEE